MSTMIPPAERGKDVHPPNLCNQLFEIYMGAFEHEPSAKNALIMIVESFEKKGITLDRPRQKIILESLEDIARKCDRKVAEEFARRNVDALCRLVGITAQLAR